MQLIDSHCHLDLLDLGHPPTDLAHVMAETVRQGIIHLLCVSVTLEDFPSVCHIAEQYNFVSASVGLHPNEKVNAEPSVETLVSLASHEKVVAIGETGLDYYRSEGDLTWQQNRFRQHILAAKITKKPLIIHTRQARTDTIALLQAENAAEVGGVMHCFTEDWDTAKAALDLGFYISFSGIITFSNAKSLHEVVKKVPIDRLLIETDSPFLAPVPNRGKSNIPAYVRYVADAVATLKQLSIETVAAATTQNFFNCFKEAKNTYV